jgi:hypothetical protein
MQNSIFDPFWTSPFGGALAPQIKKITQNKKLSEFNFRKVYFMPKILNLDFSDNFGGPLGPPDGPGSKSCIR